MAYTSIYNGSQADKGIGASYVPTLQSVPTSSTLTYTRTDLPSGSQTVNFEIGQLCRVANVGSSTGYDFYQLQNIVVTNAGEQDETTTASWLKTNIVYPVMGASGTNHSSGLVPDPGSTQGNTKFLREDGTWNVPVDTTYSNATQSAAGLMSATDKKKADNVMNLTNSETTTGSLELTPNILYSFGALTGALTVTLGSVVSGIPNTYMMEFDINDSAATPTKVPNFPATIVWKEEPVWATGKHYEVSIRYSANTQAYYGIIAEFETYVAS